MKSRIKVLAAVACSLCLIYVSWLTTDVIGPLGWTLWFAEVCVASLSFLFLINHWHQRHVFKSKYPPRGSLDVFIPVVNEPLSMITKTVKAATKINYASKQIYLLDDGHRLEIQQLAKKLNVSYMTRPTREHNKAGNLNSALVNTNGDYVLVLDADQITKPQIAKELLGHFQADPLLAFVTTRQKFSVPKSDFNHDTIFYDHMQPGKNVDNAAISCGSGVIYKRSHLDVIGGFQTWSIVEDLYTSYTFHRHGFKSLYVNKSYTVGIAPVDLRDIYKQRGIWAYDTLRMFFYQSPLTVKGLTIMQRLHYFEISWAYLVSALILPVLYLLPAMGLFADTPIIHHEKLYYLFRLPSLITQLWLYYLVSGKSFATTRFWGALCFLYFRSFWWSLLAKNRPYSVTAKTKSVHRNVILILPHIVFIGINLAAIIWRIANSGPLAVSAIWTSQIWLVLMLYWFAPLLKKGLGVSTKLDRGIKLGLRFYFQPTMLTIDKRAGAQ